MPIQVEGLVSHIAVFDMPTAVAFYRDVLGFTVVNQSEPGDDFDWGFLRLGGAELMLNTQYDRAKRPSAPDAARIKAHEDTTLYFASRDVDEAYAHVRAKGIDAKPPKVSWYGMKQIYVKDPDGYVICFQSKEP